MGEMSPPAIQTNRGIVFFIQSSWVSLKGFSAKEMIFTA